MTFNAPYSTFLSSAKISKNKTKIMAFKGKLNVHSKIVLEKTTLDQVQQFNYLGCET
jgi:hypothetical protein